MNLSSFFEPKSVAVVGVSENPKKLGSIIFQNILDSEYSGKLIPVNPKMGEKKFLGKNAVASLNNVSDSIDLVLIVVPSRFVESVIDDCVLNRTKNVIIISAGFKEVGEGALEKKILRKCEENSISLLGPNCLGVIFPYVNLNASFSDGYPRKGNIAFISQSGAFCTAVLDWADKKEIGFSHFISLGNKAGISEIDLLENLANDPKVEVFALYLESIKDGKKLLESISKISGKKPVIVLEPGESVAAQKASSSHTGALAPNAVVVREAYKESGAIQVFSMRDMFSVLEMLTFSQEKNFGKRVGVITNAGGVGVLSSDLVAESYLDLASISEQTQKKLQEKLPVEAGVGNPIDIIGDAASDRYKNSLEILEKDPNVDQILVLLTPQRTTEIEETARIISDISRKSKKNIVASFVGGNKVESGKKVFREQKIPYFNFPSDAVKVMGLVAKGCERELKIKKEELREKREESKNPEIGELFKRAKRENLKSLPASSVRKLLLHYGLDVPPAETFTDKNEALKFARKSFPGNLVMKISSPDALHKTELKGVFLNINSQEKFEKAWENLWESIEIAQLPMASVQLQEQIDGGSEIILGVNDDPSFGKIMVFGSGGIYTEIFQDTTIRILPSTDFEAMVLETKIGKILYGVRGESPKAVQKLIFTMARVTQMVQDFPEILSIDANPVFVTENRAVCVDFKVYV